MHTTAKFIFIHGILSVATSIILIVVIIIPVLHVTLTRWYTSFETPGHMNRSVMRVKDRGFSEQYHTVLCAFCIKVYSYAVRSLFSNGCRLPYLAMRQGPGVGPSAAKGDHMR